MEPCVVIAVAVNVCFVVAFIVANERAKALREAKKAYLAGLERLKADPHNPDLREETIALGRRYIDAARRVGGGKGATVFDELTAVGSGEISATGGVGVGGTMDDKGRKVARRGCLLGFLFGASVVCGMAFILMMALSGSNRPRVMWPEIGMWGSAAISVGVLSLSIARVFWEQDKKAYLSGWVVGLFTGLVGFPNCAWWLSNVLSQ